MVFADGARGEAREEHDGWRAADGYGGGGSSLRELSIACGRSAGRLVGHWAEAGAVDLDHGCAGSGWVGRIDQIIGGIKDGPGAGALGIHAEDSGRIGCEGEGLGGAGLSVDGSGERSLRFAGEFPGDLEIDLSAGDGE